MSNTYSYDNLIQLTADGMQVASYLEIRNAIANQMKAIYGNDIELSSASADGQYIAMEALLLDSMYRSCEQFVANMSPQTATGQYLDIICSLSNIHRKPATCSTADVCIKNISGEQLTNITNITLFDNTGIQWSWYGSKISLAANATINLVFTCDQYGPIAATAAGETPDWSATPAGSICKPLEGSKFACWQIHDAELGSYKEDDTSLRRRQRTGGGSNATTTQAAMETALENIPGVEDVYIINNNTSGTITSVNDMSDGTNILSHNVYVCLKYSNANESTIASTLYEKMTPGVYTQEPAASGTLQGGETVSKPLTFDSGLSCPVYWKKCSGVHPTITATFNYLDSYAKGTGGEPTTDQELAIEEAILTACNKVSIGTKLLAADVSTAIQNADMKPKGYTTFYITSCSFPSSAALYNAPWTYYDYNNVTFTYTGTTTGTCTLTIGYSAS